MGLKLSKFSSVFDDIAGQGFRNFGINLGYERLQSLREAGLLEEAKKACDPLTRDRRAQGGPHLSCSVYYCVEVF